MTNYTKFLTPGTPLSCAAYAVSNTRRGTGMRWTASEAPVPQGHKHGLESAVVEVVKLGANERKAVTIAPISVRGAVDLQSIKQFRVPLYLRERRT
jgi:hypothetical protein